jgi:hypothetical protein
MAGFLASSGLLLIYYDELDGCFVTAVLVGCLMPEALVAGTFVGVSLASSGLLGLTAMEGFFKPNPLVGVDLVSLAPLFVLAGLDSACLDVAGFLAVVLDAVPSLLGVGLGLTGVLAGLVTALVVFLSSPLALKAPLVELAVFDIPNDVPGLLAPPKDDFILAAILLLSDS